jgi:hypothetical protein
LRARRETDAVGVCSVVAGGVADQVGEGLVEQNSAHISWRTPSGCWERATTSWPPGRAGHASSPGMGCTWSAVRIDGARWGWAVR